MVIETARHLAGLEKANSAEFDPDTPDPVIATMASQVDVIAGERGLGGTMRLGSYPASLQRGSVAAEAYGSTEVTERHRHRYEVNNDYRDRLQEAGLVFSGTSPDGLLVEFAELPRDVHPFFVGTQAHPELKSRPTRSHPLFRAFVRAAIDYSESTRLPVPFDEAEAEAEKVGI
jgi:CTP synthase